MNLYEVGKKVISPGPEGVTFDLTDSGAVLLIQMNRPTAREKQEFKNGLSFRFAVVDDIIFILSRMGTLPWMDSPYYRTDGNGQIGGYEHNSRRCRTVRRLKWKTN